MVRRDYLELIDEARYSELPSGAYAKGFIRAYASFLGVDPGPYLDDYDLATGGAGPELSEVVRQPVRVPRSTQPRAWRIAAFGAAAMLVILGLLGMFRSGEEDLPAPTVAPEVLAAISSPLPNSLGAVVRVELIGEASWIRATAGGQTIYEGTLRKGQDKTFRASDAVVLELGNPSAVRVFANGNDVGTPSQERYRGTFTPTTNAMPPPEPDGSDPSGGPTP